MGYLDGDTITVDAILTKKGRELLSKGANLAVSAFSLSDTGIDYTLWNADHPSGSAFYGEAIEKLPQIEALPQSHLSMRNRLITLNRDTISMPVLELTPDPTATFIFDTKTPKDFTATVVGFSGGGGGGASGMHCLVSDSNVVTLNGTKIDITGNALSFITEVDIPAAALYEMTQAAGTQAAGSMSWTFKVTPQIIRTELGATTLLTFIDLATGAWASINVKVNFNKDARALVTATSIKGP